MHNDTSSAQPVCGARPLKIAAGMLFLLAAAHLLCLFRLEAVFRLYDIEPFMRQLAEYGAALPYAATVGMAAGLSVCGLYALSAAGRVGRLPLLYPALYALAAVFLLRMAAGTAHIIAEGSFPATEWTAALLSGTSGALLLTGGIRARKTAAI